MMAVTIWTRTIIFSTIFLCFYSVVSLGADSTGCVFKSDGVNPVPIEYYGPPVENQELSNGTCSRYSDSACCDPYQVSVLESKLALLEGIYGRCPSCYLNLVDLFCTYICSPDQATFVENTVVENTSVLATTFRVDPIYANSIYESCMWVELSGVIVTKDVFHSFPDFFEFLGSYDFLNQYISFDYKFNSSLALLSAPCSDSCSCQNCQPVCSHPPNTDAEYFECSLEFIGAKWDCVTMGLLSGYVGLVTAGFIGIIITFFFRTREAGGAYTNITTSTNTHYSNRSSIGSSSFSVRRNSPWFSQYWMAHGKFVANHPTMILVGSVLLIGGCAFGLMKFEFETNPQNLWTTSTSRAVHDQDYINDHFGKIYRQEQLIITSKASNQSIFLRQPFLQAFDLQDTLSTIQVTVKNQTYSFQDLCYQPTGQGCFIESPFEYWQNNRTKLVETADIRAYIENCTSNALQSNCLSSLSLPINPNSCFGGFSAEKDYGHSKALVVTFLMKNGEDVEEAAKAWEKEFLDLAGESYQDIKVAYSTERSLEDEISSEQNPDIELIAIAYCLMLVYLTLSLGFIFPLRGVLVKTKFLLSLAGMVILLSSMVMSVGICSALGVKATFIASQTLPFLMLAIGLDNLFVILAKYEKLSSVVIADDTRLGQTLAEVGNSTSVAAMCQVVAFLLGVVTKMPAIRNLAIYASLSVFFNYVLQVTAFCVLMVLDGNRVRKTNRVDCLPCVRTAAPSHFSKRAMSERKSLVGNTTAPEDPTNSVVKKFFKNYITSPLFNPAMKVFVAFMFAGMVFVGVNYSIHMHTGLKQQDVVPSNSYLVEYYDSLSDYLTVGPPMYITVKNGYNYTDINEQDKLCTNFGCNNNSLINSYDGAQFIGGSSFSWLDDYLQWAATTGCCQQQNGIQCIDDFTNCTPCFENLGPKKRPSPEDFNKYLPWFLSSTITSNCKIAGLLYADDVQLNLDYNGTSGHFVESSRIRLYHTALESQSKYIHAIEVAYKVQDELGVEAFPFSGYFVFYEQYLDMQKIAVLDIVIALGAIFVVTLLLRNPWVSLLMVTTLAMITVDLIGAMNLFKVELNSVTVVNLVMSIGIGVQFCIHTGYHFSINPIGTKTERAKKALTEVSSPLVCGITFTKIIGIIAFAFGSASMMEGYFFTVYLCFLFLAALHGFVFFPVLLSFLGTEAGTLAPFQCHTDTAARY